MGAKASSGRPAKSSKTGPEFQRLSMTRLTPYISLLSLTASRAPRHTPRRPYFALSGSLPAFSTRSRHIKPRSPTGASSVPATLSAPARAVNSGTQKPRRVQRRSSSAPQLKNGSITGSPPPWSSMSPFAAMCSTEKLPSAALFSSRSGRETYSFPVGIYLADIGRPRNLI